MNSTESPSCTISFRPLILRDAVLDVNNVIAHGQVAEVGNKRRRLRSLGLGPRRHIGFVGKIVGPEDNQIRVGKAHARWPAACAQSPARADRRPDSFPHRAWFRRDADCGCPADTESDTRAALWPGAPHRPGAARPAQCATPRHQILQLLGERGNRAMKAQRGPRVQLDLAQRRVLIQHVHHAQLIEIEAHVRVERACSTSGRR
jgi:hypothetical protein